MSFDELLTNFPFLYTDAEEGGISSTSTTKNPSQDADKVPQSIYDYEYRVYRDEMLGHADQQL